MLKAIAKSVSFKVLPERIVRNKTPKTLEIQRKFKFSHKFRFERFIIQFTIINYKIIQLYNFSNEGFGYVY